MDMIVTLCCFVFVGRYAYAESSIIQLLLLGLLVTHLASNFGAGKVIAVDPVECARESKRARERERCSRFLSPFLLRYNWLSFPLLSPPLLLNAQHAWMWHE